MQTKNGVVRSLTFANAADDSINIQCYSAPNEYKYTIDAASSLASSVRMNAGAGKL